MDILDIHAEIKNFKTNGVTLNLDERYESLTEIFIIFIFRVQLELALMKL